MSRAHLSTSLGCAALAALLAAGPAAAGPGYQLNGFVTSPANEAALVAATEKLQASPIMKESKGRLLLLANLADGADPATHSFAILFGSLADFDAFGRKLRADPAWTEFVGTLSKLGHGAGTARFATLESWGDLSDGDSLWLAFSRRVHDPSAYLATLDRFMGSETGKAFPGQVHLSAIVAAGFTKATHATVVGYASAAEMEKWVDANRSNPEYLAFVAELDRSSEAVGTQLTRTIGAWGPASLKDLYGR